MAILMFASGAFAIITPAGKVSDTIITISDLGHDPAVAFNGTHFLALWVHDFDFLYGALISESGTIANPGIILLNKDNKQIKEYDGPSVASTDSIFLVIWSPYSVPG